MTAPRHLYLIKGGEESLFDPFNDAYIIAEARKALGLPPLELVEEDARESA